MVSEEKPFSLFCFFQRLSAWSRTGSREQEHEKAHGSSADTNGLQVCADVACRCCSCSAGSTSVLGVAGLRPHRIAIARLRPLRGKTNTFFPTTHHDIERLQVLEVLLRSGSIRVGLTFVARLMVVLGAERGRGMFEVASESEKTKRW